MERDVLSTRQVMVLIIVALAGPLIDLVPRLAAQTAGGAGWVIALGALPLLLASLWSAGGQCRGDRKHGAFSRFLCCGTVITYLLWTPLALALFLRLSGARLADIYGQGPAFLCTAALLLAAVWMALGKVSAFARAGEIFYLALAVVLAAVLFLAVPEVEWGNFLSSRKQTSSVSVLTGSVMTAGIILNVYPASIFKNKVEVKSRDGRRAVGWILALVIVTALLVGGIIGCLGPRLTARVSSPFLIMVQGLGIKGAFQRMEALIVALLILSDLTMAGLLLHSWRELMASVCRRRWSRWCIIPMAAVALLAGWICLPETEKVKDICIVLLSVSGLMIGLLWPVLLRILTWRKKPKT